MKYLKHTILNILFGVNAFCCICATAQEPSREFRITAKFDDLPNDVLIYLIRLHNGDTIATAKSSDGKFQMSGNYELDGEMHFLKVDTIGMNLKSAKRNWIRLFFDNDPIKIVGSFEEWPEVTISGSPSTKVYEEMLKLIIPISQDADQRLKDANLDSTARAKIVKEAVSKQLEIYYSHTNEFAAAEFARNTRADYSELSALYLALSDKVKVSYPGKLLLERVDQLRPENAIKENNLVPNFAYRDRNGNVVNIREVIGDSQYTLIDFWASWCKPCLDEMPKLRGVLDKYSIGQFQIIGLSIDSENDSWLKAMELLSPSRMRHGIDLNGRVVRDIGFSAIPAYLLVDSKGRMIAFYNASGKNRSFGQSIKSDDVEKVLRKLLP